MRQFHNNFALLLAAATLAAGCSEPAGGQARRGAGPVIAVRTTTVQRMAIQRQVDLAGTLMSPDQARVSAEAAGIVRQVLVEIGREVRAGDPLVRLETRELSLAVARAESALRLPIAFGRGAGSGSRASMAVTIIGGQILCLLLTLLITPVVYSYFDGMRAWRPSDLLSPLRKLWRPGVPAPRPVKTEP